MSDDGEIQYAVMPSSGRFDTRHAAVGAAAILERDHPRVIDSAVIPFRVGSNLDETLEAMATHYEDMEVKPISTDQIHD